MVGKLQQVDSAVSIFQIGSVSNPGISDIDMLVVFEDGTKCNLNPLDGLSRTERYLFSHSLYGISKRSFSESQRYTFFHNHNLLWGEKLPIVDSDLSEEEVKTLKTQTALEYLIQMFVSSTVELTYGIVKVRGFLMHVKALSYDLEFLNVSSGRLFELIQTIIGWREHWFEEKPDNKTIKSWFLEFCTELTTFLEIELSKRTFYLPGEANLQIARNMMIEPSEKFGYSHTGMILPSFFGGLGRRYFNIQHRFNRFRFRIPVAVSNIPDVLRDRFVFARQMKRANNDFLPYFMPLTSSLNIFS
jgi:hypothetical protein